MINFSRDQLNCSSVPFSDAFSFFPFDSAYCIYKAPMNYGPMNLLYLKPTTYQAAMVGFPYDDIKTWRYSYPEYVFARAFHRVADNWEKGLPVLEKVLPKANLIGFTKPSEAVAYAKTNRVALAFLDIELGKASGLDLCRTLLEINPRTNVVFLTAYREYSVDAWNTGASGFMMKPITVEGVREQLKNLRHRAPADGLYPRRV